MDRLALYVNDAAHAAPLIEALMHDRGCNGCTVVLCPPRLSHHIGRFLSDRQRRQWRTTWSERVRRDLQAMLPPQAAPLLRWTLADHPLPRTATRLKRELGSGLRLLDLRHHAAGQAPAPLVAVPGTAPSAWGAQAAVTSGVAAVLALVD